MSIQFFQNPHLSTPLIGLDRVDHQHCKFYAVLDSPDVVGAINAKYGAGAATIVGNPTFVAGRGVKANVNGDGVILNFAVIDAANKWRGHFGSRGQLSVYLEKDLFFDNTDSASQDLPTDYNDGNPFWSGSSSPRSVGMPPFLSTNTFKNVLDCRMSGNNSGINVRLYGADDTNQVHNGLVGSFVNAGIHKRYQCKLHSNGSTESRSHLAFSMSWNGQLHGEYIDGMPTLNGGWARAAVASTFYKMGEHHAAHNKPFFPQLDMIAIGGSNATNGTTIGTSCISDTGNDVYIYAIVVGSEPLDFKIHPDFRMPVSFGASYSPVGGIADSHSVLRSGSWDKGRWISILKILAANGYHANFCRQMSVGGHTIAYREAPYAYPTPILDTQQGICPEHGVDHLEQMLALQPSIIFYSDGPNDTSLIRNSTDPNLRAQWVEDQRRLFRRMLESGAKVCYVSFMGSPFYDNQNASWIPNMLWTIERGLELKEWVLSNMGEYYAKHIEVEDARPYFNNYLQPGDIGGVISKAPNKLYENDGTNGFGYGQHLILPGRELQTKARIACMKRLTGLK